MCVSLQFSFSKSPAFLTGSHFCWSNGVYLSLWVGECEIYFLLSDPFGSQALARLRAMVGTCLLNFTFPRISSFLCPFIQANRKFGEPTLEAAMTWIYTARLFFSYSVLCRPCSDCFWTGARSQYHPYAGAGTWDVTRNKVVPAGRCALLRPDLRSIPSSLTFRFACRPGISCDASCSSCDAASSCASFCWRRPPCEFLLIHPSFLI